MALNSTVRLFTKTGLVEVVGVDRQRGFSHQGLTYSADLYGPSTASFDLKRSTLVTWPDLAAWTPVEIEVDGVLCWSGRIKETPYREGSEPTINVQCEGWQYHLDDDAVAKWFVHTNLSDYKDIRSIPGATLGAGNSTVSGQIAQDNAVTVGWPTGSALTPNASVIGVLDLGSAQAARVSFDFTSSNNAATINVQVLASDNPLNSYGGGTFDTIYSAALSAGSTVTASTTTPRRYIHLRLVDASFTGTTGADHWIRFTGVRVYTATGYESSNQSVLKASDVITNIRTLALPSLSTDVSRILSTSFSIPSLGTAITDPKTPREWFDAVQAFHNYRLQVDRFKRLIFEPLPSSATVEIGPASTATVDDASVGSVEEIYNKVIVTGSDVDGTPVVTTLTQTVRGITTNRTKILPISNPINTTTSTQIGNTFLLAHRTTPMRGTITGAGRTAFRDAKTGLSVPPAAMCSMTGELIRLTNKSNPDTGGFGREARIANVTYTLADDRAEVTLDDTRRNFEAFLSRLALVTPGGS